MGVSRDGSTLWFYEKNSKRDTAFYQYQEGNIWCGQVIIPKVAAENVFSLLHSGNIAQTTIESTTQPISQNAATKVFQNFRVAAAGDVDAVGSDGKVIWGMSSKGELIASISANRVKGLSTDILGDELEI
ncbi:TPA: hypothetical protein U2I65_003949 [Providencia stuartii]|nr:hypothetical protein [Providencia stuartii]